MISKHVSVFYSPMSFIRNSSWRKCRLSIPNALIILDRNFASKIFKKLFFEETVSFEFYFSIQNECNHSNKQVLEICDLVYIFADRHDLLYCLFSKYFLKNILFINKTFYFLFYFIVIFPRGTAGYQEVNPPPPKIKYSPNTSKEIFF